MLLGAIVAGALLGQVSLEAEPVEVEPPRAPGNHMVELGLVTGVFLPSSDHELYDSLATDHAAFDPVAPTVGVRLSYFPFPYVGAEAEGAYMPTRSAGDLAHLFAVRGHVMVQGPWRWAPFALAGGGLLGSEGAPGGDIDQAFHWGLGLKFYIDHQLSARLDGRHIYSGAEGPGEGNTHHFEVLLGVSFTLFRSDPAPNAETDPEPSWKVAETGPPAPEPVPPPAPEPEPVRREMVAPASAIAVVRRALQKVHFAFGSAVLGPASYPALDLVADMLRRNPSLRVEIVGHTDHVGTEAYNQRLSEERANSVRSYLIEVGIAEARLRCRGMGEIAPVAPNDSAAGRAKNRRSEVNIEGAKAEPADTDPLPEISLPPLSDSSEPQ